jgi:NAD(P)-dependent dehydrogenase (short-subunit alcohol dehydrogenase family)
MALLKGKTAVITGGSTGIGLATAKRFVEEGAYVFINGRSQAELDAAVKEIGENVTGVQGDGSKQGDRDRLYTAVADAGRGLDVVFANAAAIDVARIGEVTQEHLRKALPLLNDGGSIILNSSDPNAKGHDGIAVYAAIMAALRSLGPTWAGELRDRKIRVNVISPAEEVANTALLLASGQSSLTTGADTPVDGGRVSGLCRPPGTRAARTAMAQYALSLGRLSWLPHHQTSGSRPGGPALAARIMVSAGTSGGRWSRCAWARSCCCWTSRS